MKSHSPLISFSSLPSAFFSPVDGTVKAPTYIHFRCYSHFSQSLEFGGQSIINIIVKRTHAFGGIVVQKLVLRMELNVGKGKQLLADSEYDWDASVLSTRVLSRSGAMHVT